MSYHEGSNWQAKKEDKKEPLYKHETSDELHSKLYPESAGKKEYIICAALWLNDGKKHKEQPSNITEGLVITGRRHSDAFAVLINLNVHFTTIGITDGFLTSKNRFVNRLEAGKVAFDAGQTPELEPCLFSEHLY